MPRALTLFFGIILIIFGVLAFYGYFIIDPLWVRVTIIVIGGLSFLISLVRRR
jgi:hypothetical protein